MLAVNGVSFTAREAEVFAFLRPFAIRLIRKHKPGRRRTHRLRDRALRPLRDQTKVQ
jgi:hypothetical protein